MAIVNETTDSSILNPAMMNVGDIFYGVLEASTSDVIEIPYVAGETVFVRIAFDNPIGSFRLLGDIDIPSITGNLVTVNASSGGSQFSIVSGNSSILASDSAGAYLAFFPLSESGTLRLRFEGFAETNYAIAVDSTVPPALSPTPGPTGPTPNDDVLLGTTNDDTIDLLEGNDSYDGDDGNDIIRGNRGDDTLDGGDGNDGVYGGRDNDEIDGGAGNDNLRGDSGDDIVRGGADNDRVAGNSGDDAVYGDAGNDRVLGGSGDDTVEGGDDSDIVRGGSGNDTVDGGAGSDKVRGDSGNDEVHGGSGNDRISGNSDDDLLFGGSGIDIVRGGGGDDMIDGGADADLLTGDADNDTFVFASVADAIGDVVTGGNTVSASMAMLSGSGSDLDVLDLRGLGNVNVISETDLSDTGASRGIVEFLGEDDVVLGTLEFSQIELFLVDPPMEMPPVELPLIAVDHSDDLFG